MAQRGLCRSNESGGSGESCGLSAVRGKRHEPGGRGETDGLDVVVAGQDLEATLDSHPLKVEPLRWLWQKPARQAVLHESPVELLLARIC